MSSTSSRRKHRTELASFHSAFLADDTLVTIVPNFDLENPVTLLSARAPAGPFQAGIPADVPLWLAMLLQQRSLCSLKVPKWLSPEHLKQVKQFEQNETVLTPPFSGSTATTEHDDEEDDYGKSTFVDQSPTLPYYYAELGNRFTSAKTSALGAGGNSSSSHYYGEDGGTSLAGSAAQAPKASSLLLADICQIRLDKLRQQFQGLVDENRENTHIAVVTPGIGSVELAQLKPIILQGLQDQGFLALAGTTTTNNTASNSSRARKTAAGDDEPMSATQESESRGNTNALRSRIRRFRGGE